jgi:hypothetical protein
MEEQTAVRDCECHPLPSSSWNSIEKMAEPGSGQKATSKDCMCDGAIGRSERNHSME